MNKSIVIECKDLTKSYHDGAVVTDILRGINLQVHAGEMIAIVSMSGSGKTTLLQLLGGLDEPSSGSVSLLGKDLAMLKEHEKCQLRNLNLGFVYQFHHLLPEFTALENVCMPLLIRSLSPKQAEEKAKFLLDQVGLAHRFNHKIGELSGGERQRVAIARALVTNPQCVLADEPTGNLDPRNAEKVLQIFFDLQRACQTSVVIVTHDLQIAKQADCIFTIDDGKLVRYSSSSLLSMEAAG